LRHLAQGEYVRPGWEVEGGSACALPMRRASGAVKGAEAPRRARAAALWRRAVRARLSLKRRSASQSDTLGSPKASLPREARTGPLILDRWAAAHRTSSSRPSRRTGISLPRLATSPCNRSKKKTHVYSVSIRSFVFLSCPLRCIRLIFVIIVTIYL